MRISLIHIFMASAVTALEAAWCGENVPDKTNIVLVNDAQPLAEIVVPEKGLKEGEAVHPPLDFAKTPQVLAETLAEYIQKSTGAKLPMVKETAREPDRVAIHCGNTEYVRKLNLPLEGMDEDEFLIAFPDPKNIVIAADYQHGVEWGVCEFLERYVGVRWLFAGPLGEHVPRHKTLAIPAKEVRSKPAYLERDIHFDLKEMTAWSRFSRLRRRIKNDHNLGVLFSPAKHQATHPEFFPIQNGQRLLRPPTLAGWQPCFNAPGLVDKAVRTIAEYFRADSKQHSYPLSVNDGDGFCECPSCLAKDGNKTNDMGSRDRSKSYYEFCNRVAEGVAKTFPDARFGLLAYGAVVEPPEGIKLNEHLVPFFTYEWMKWADKTARKERDAFMRRWAEHCREVGWYDYIYGKFYSVPRVYFHTMADYLRYGYANQVRYYTAEVYTPDDYREGPKEYMTMKLLWNPSLDVDATLKEWYECAVGPKAAPWLAKYFSFWENFWTNRIPRSAWFRSNVNSLYLGGSGDGYIKELKEQDFVNCGKLLEKTLNAAATEIQRQRVQLWLDGFQKVKIMALLKIHFEELNRHLDAAKDVRQVSASGFDQNIDGWGTWKNDYIRARFSWDDQAGHAAPGALLIDRTDDQDLALAKSGGAVFLKSFPAVLGKAYRISVWIKTEGIAPDAQVSVSTGYQTKGKTGEEASPQNWVPSPSQEASVPRIEPGQWRKVEMLCQVPEDPRIGYLTVLLNFAKSNTGKVWFDDFSLSEVSLPQND